MSTFLKAEQIISAALGLLRRELVLPGLVWRDAAGDFAGTKGDTISIRLPAYAKARTRALRSGDARIRDSLAELKVDVSLDTDVYKDIRITDEELTLDIVNFGAQVLTPVMMGVAETLEDGLITTAQDASYAQSIAYTYGTDDAWKDLIIPARELLNKARVPQAGRVLAVGSGVETELLSTDLFVKANESGSTSALEDATLGRKAGFTIVSVPGLDPDEAYAFHRSAYVMSQRAPVVPAGAPFGATSSFMGYAMRTVRVLDSDTIEDILAVDSWVGYNTVKDPGYFDSNGRWQPTDAEPGTAFDITATAATDTVNANAHGLSNGDRIVFTALTGGGGLTTNREYYVIGATANDFQVADTAGGTAIDITSDATAGSARESGSEMLVRSVKISAS
jgi:hypothetical protein